MKKMSFYMLLASCLWTSNMQAQFIPASNPDFVFPPAAAGVTANPTHMSSFDYEVTAMGTWGNFNAYSWSNDNSTMPNNSGIAFAFTDITNSVLFDQGFISLTAKEVEIAVVEFNGAVQVLVSYEDYLGGVYADIYEYTTTGTLSPVLTGNMLDPNGNKPRISQMKAHNIVIAYETPTGIAMNTYTPISGFTPTCYMAGTAGAVIPDVSLNANSNALDVYIAYYNPAANEIVLEFLDLPTVEMGGMFSFNIVDNNPLSIVPQYIDLDSWYTPTGATQWAYAYDQQYMLLMRLFNPAASPMLMDVQLTTAALSGNFAPVKPSLTYDNSGNVIDIAWSQFMLSGIANPTIGMQLDNLGNNLFGTSYLEVQQTGMPLPQNYSLVALSKNKFNSVGDIFCAFSLDYTMLNADINYKFKSSSAGSTYNAKQLNKAGVQLYPNPFNNQVSLAIDKINGDDIIYVNVYDITGKQIMQSAATIDEVNHQLNNAAAKWSNGVYMLKVVNGQDISNLKMIKQ